MNGSRVRLAISHAEDRVPPRVYGTPPKAITGKRATRCFPCAVEDLIEANGRLSDRLRSKDAENETLRAAIQIISPDHSLSEKKG